MSFSTLLDTCVLIISDRTVVEACCTRGTGGMESFPAFREECMTSGLRHRTPNDTFRCRYLSTAVSSLVEAGTVKDLRDLSKRVHCVHKFLYLGCVLSWLVVDIQSRVIGLLQCVNPREELSQSRDTPVSTLQPLSLVS